ncbi:hypothetical protein QL408_22665, partial [Bacillus subtilis]|nr:hypothetical protein [Bacillus subtilis]
MWDLGYRSVNFVIHVGNANPARQVGPAFGEAGVNFMGLFKEFN